MANCVYVPKATVDEALRNQPVQGKHSLEPLKALAAASGLPMNVLEDHEVVNDAEVHHHEDDLWFCLEGDVAFTYGGELADPWYKKNLDGTEDRREIKAKEVRGGKTIVMRPGDWLYVPAGQPHKHDCLNGTARLVIVKLPAKRPVA